MKNIFISFFIFFCMILGIIFSLNALDRIYGNLDNLNSKLEQSIEKEDWESANLLVNEISDEWHENCNKLYIFLNHNEIDNINSELSKLTQYIKYNNKEESMASLYVVKFFFQHTLDLEKISYQNIF
ncbi:DUF4363 family protein [Clostridium sp. MSJ-11]|uniref:DUF4363 family protein n=1 Tax=Clostridium mobile TaxID=2841512 RepID=A0ABS6EN41_9CLOT|nr:DUF4363 family protein [Clostridium mobile]MBU5486071.1 DUF4363 family protein [Clostridium mobile]